MDKILKFLNDNSPFYFATTDGERAYIRPFGFVMEYNHKLYFSMGNHKESYRQLVTHPEFEVCTANKEGEWIRIRGEAVEDLSEEVENAGFAQNPSLRDIYNEKSGLKLGFFYVKNGIAEFCDMKGNYEKVEIGS